MVEEGAEAAEEEEFAAGAAVVVVVVVASDVTTRGDEEEESSGGEREARKRKSSGPRSGVDCERKMSFAMERLNFKSVGVSLLASLAVTAGELATAAMRHSISCHETRTGSYHF